MFLKKLKAWLSGLGAMPLQPKLKADTLDTFAERLARKSWPCN